MLRLSIALITLLAAQGAAAEIVELRPSPVTVWKSVYGEVEPRDLIPARARISGTLVALDVSAGDRVQVGQPIARVEDDKLAFQINAIDAQLGALRTQLATARTDLERGQSLDQRGVITAQRLDQLRTAVDVLQSNIESTEAQRFGIEQQIAEGAVLSPVAGIVLQVPVARGSVIGPGETVAQIAGGGVFLRLALPERYAAALTVGDEIRIGDGAQSQSGKLVKVYPQIAGGRVLTDVEVAGLEDRFIGLRVPVRLPIGETTAYLVPQGALSRHGGLDFVTVETAGVPVQRVVVPGNTHMRDGEQWVEILSGLAEGDKVLTSHD